MIRKHLLLLIKLALFSMLSQNAQPLQLSMVASRPPIGSVPNPSIIQQRTTGQVAGGFGLTSGLISQLAIAAIKARLRDERLVACDIEASTSNLILRGGVGPVTVRGRGWRSERGLSCRALEATVDSCELDTAKIISNQKLVLKSPACGRAMIALDSTDFGNFITHHLVKPPSNARGGPIEFLKHSIKIDPSTGSVRFLVKYFGREWNCMLKRSNNSDRRAVVMVAQTERSREVENAEVSKELSRGLTDYFNSLVFELDGTFLHFQDMMITDKGATPCVMLSLSITVHKFPSRALAF